MHWPRRTSCSACSMRRASVTVVAGRISNDCSLLARAARDGAEARWPCRAPRTTIRLH